MRFYYDDRGRYRGHSIGCLGSFLGFWAGVMVLALVIGWPLLVHGPAGVFLEIAWITVAGTGALWLFSRRSAPRAGGSSAAVAPAAPVFDGDKPELHHDERPSGRSVGTKFQD